MKTVLIISPRFPPINAPDMHRVRHSLPYFEALGWNPEVWVVDPQRIERDRDPLLAHTVPQEASVHTVGALDPAWTRLVGLGSLALRSLPFYARAVSQRLARGDVDLVYFSTTAFPVMVLGRYWKRRFGVPYIIDMQDPWHNTFYLDQSPEERPPKFWFSYRLHKYLEPVAMRAVGGIISVSQGYCDTLCRRYANITPERCTVIPFGAAAVDYEVMETQDVEQSLVRRMETRSMWYTPGGAGTIWQPRPMLFSLPWLKGRRQQPSLFERVRLHFVGTSYAPGDTGKKTLEPLAQAHGVAAVVHEYPARIPYFQALRLLRDASHLLIPGSTDPHYTASKLYPYILSRRPVLAVFHERSSVVDILRDTNAGTAIAFGDQVDHDALTGRILTAWTELLHGFRTRLPPTGMRLRPTRLRR